MATNSCGNPLCGATFSSMESCGFGTQKVKQVIRGSRNAPMQSPNCIGACVPNSGEGAIQFKY